MQLLRTNGKSTLTKSGPDLDQGVALWFLLVTKNQPLQMGDKVWAPWKNVMICACSFRGLGSAIRGTVEGAGLFRGQ